MGAVFAIQVRTGKEVVAKEMLKDVLVKKSDTLVKSIYACETHTEFLNRKSAGVNTDAVVNEQDITGYLENVRYAASVNCRRKQLEAIDRYDSPEYEKIKMEYRKEIRELENIAIRIRNTTKKIHSVLSGYLLVEFHWNSEYMPNHMWHLIKSVPLVNNILSTDPIPEWEMEQFISNYESLIEPKAIIDFGKVVEDEEAIVSELLYKANMKETTKDMQEEIIEQIEDARFDVVEKVKGIIHSKPVSVLSKIKAFIKRKNKMVSMPLHFLKRLYTNEELEFISKKINARDFLFRLKQFSCRKIVLE